MPEATATPLKSRVEHVAKFACELRWQGEPFPLDIGNAFAVLTKAVSEEPMTGSQKVLAAMIEFAKSVENVELDAAKIGDLSVMAKDSEKNKCYSMKRTHTKLMQILVEVRGAKYAAKDIAEASALGMKSGKGEHVTASINKVCEHFKSKLSTSLQALQLVNGGVPTGGAWLKGKSFKSFDALYAHAEVTILKVSGKELKDLMDNLTEVPNEERP